MQETAEYKEEGIKIFRVPTMTEGKLASIGNASKSRGGDFARPLFIATCLSLPCRKLGVVPARGKMIGRKEEGRE